jgi:UDP-N-acetyl-D-mannosaminuronate dehydrogenase
LHQCQHKPDQLRARKAAAIGRLLLIVTDHDSIDYLSLAKSARLIVDTRNACARAGAFGPNIVKA